MPFQTKLLFFQTIESAKCAYAARAGDGDDGDDDDDDDAGGGGDDDDD